MKRSAKWSIEKLLYVGRIIWQPIFYFMVISEALLELHNIHVLSGGFYNTVSRYINFSLFLQAFIVIGCVERFLQSDAKDRKYIIDKVITAIFFIFFIVIGILYRSIMLITMWVVISVWVGGMYYKRKHKPD